MSFLCSPCAQLSRLTLVSETSAVMSSVTGTNETRCNTMAAAPAASAGRPTAAGLGCAAAIADCDDTRAEVNASRPESCNELDDNCDNRINEGFDLMHAGKSIRTVVTY